jgi:hypothetical protein
MLLKPLLELLLKDTLTSVDVLFPLKLASLKDEFANDEAASFCTGEGAKEGCL